MHVSENRPRKRQPTRFQTGNRKVDHDLQRAGLLVQVQIIDSQRQWRYTHITSDMVIIKASLAYLQKPSLHHGSPTAGLRAVMIYLAIVSDLLKYVLFCVA